MSYQCVAAVLESQLPGPRKLTLTALAERGNEDGSVMWASIRELAMRASKSQRVVTRDLAWLEEQGVITEESGRQVHGAARIGVGGRNRCTRYRLNFETLAAYRRPLKSRPPDQGFDQKPCSPDQGFEPKPCPPQHGVELAISTETMIPRAETLTLKAETLIQESPVPKEPKEPSSKTAASPRAPHTGNTSTRGQHDALSRVPAGDGNVRVIVKIAHAVFDEAGRSSPDDPDLTERVKVKCAQNHIAYKPPVVAPDALGRAMTLAHLQRTIRRRVS